MSFQWLSLISTQRLYRGVQLQDQGVVSISLGGKEREREREENLSKEDLTLPLLLRNIQHEKKMIANL